MFDKQLKKIKESKGFIAALDQSGGSTPRALKLYGVTEKDYANEQQMFDQVHKMRERIMTNRGFSGDKILGAILFEDTLDREVAKMPSAQYLWQEKQIVPFLKVDKGLEDEKDGVQLMKEIANLEQVLQKAKQQNVFGTKQRSVIKLANEKGIAENVAQQFAIGKQILKAGLVPIIEPEVDINSPEKQQAEVILKKQLIQQLEQLEKELPIMLKLSLPSEDGFYDELIAHPKVLLVVALSGGYSRKEANQIIAKNKGLVASFSRAFTEGLSKNMTDDEFSQLLGQSIDAICKASAT